MTHRGGSVGFTEALARFTAGLRFGALPASAVHLARRAILDTVGVTLAARDDPAARQLVGLIERLGGRGTATVIGQSVRTAPTEAALANGAIGHALDWDDNNIALNGHPSVVVLPAALALAEELGRGGRDLITAYVAGFEVAARVGRAVGVGSYERGWHATSTCGVVGAAAAAGVILGLDIEQTRTAFGLAASHAAGLRRNFGTMTKPYHAGNAARAGVVAALLAQQGFTADREILEGRFGLLEVVGQADRSVERGLKGLGERLHIETTGIDVKVYPACASAHHALDALLAILAEEPVMPQEVQRIVVGVPFRVPMVLIHERPTTALEGKFSMQYCLAAAILDGRIGRATFTDAMVQRPAAQALFPKIDMVVTEEGRNPMARNFAEVTLYLRCGRVFSRRVDHARGSPRNPLSDDELVAKFRDAAGAALTPAEADRAIDTLWRLDALDDVRPAIALVAGSPALTRKTVALARD